MLLKSVSESCALNLFPIEEKKMQISIFFYEEKSGVITVMGFITCSKHWMLE